MVGKLILEDGSIFEGISFGSEISAAGEVVFSTGMVGYPESLTDPSYEGQILILTYPLIGNYGVPDSALWESDRIHVSGLVVSNYIDTPSHFQSKRTLSTWLKDENIPGLEIKDTRFITQKIRDYGASLGKIIVNKEIPFIDPNKKNLVEQVSPKKISYYKGKLFGKKRVLLYIDCGGKRNMITCLLNRGADIIRVPWDFNPFIKKHDRQIISMQMKFDGIVVSNGPGDPKKAKKTIETIKMALSEKIPLLGICLGHQLLTLAAGGDTKKLKFGHRSQNQPCLLIESKHCYITTQNHGFAVSEIPRGFKPWFVNANDNSNEGMIHAKLPIMSVQFHPESNPGPMDTEWIFDYFLERI